MPATRADDCGCELGEHDRSSASHRTNRHGIERSRELGTASLGQVPRRRSVTAAAVEIAATGLEAGLMPAGCHEARSPFFLCSGAVGGERHECATEPSRTLTVVERIVTCLFKVAQHCIAAATVAWSFGL